MHARPQVSVWAQWQDACTQGRANPKAGDSDQGLEYRWEIRRGAAGERKERKRKQGSEVGAVRLRVCTLLGRNWSSSVVG